MNQNHAIVIAFGCAFFFVFFLLFDNIVTDMRDRAALEVERHTWSLICPTWEKYEWSIHSATGGTCVYPPDFRYPEGFPPAK